MGSEGAERPDRRHAHDALLVALAAAVVVADQATKWWAVNRLEGGRVIEVIWTLRLRLTTNSGIAFSLATGAGAIAGVVALGIVAVLVLYARRQDALGVLVAIGLILGGALGNLCDRVVRADDGVFSGEVVDFVDLGWWPVFNVADAAVVIGGVLLVFVGAGPPRAPTPEPVDDARG